MADCFCTPDTWPEEGNAVPCHSLIVPTWPPPGNVSSSSTQFQGLTPPWPIPVEGVVERKAASASKSHSLAEKRRRERINAQLATLRKFIPRSEKASEHHWSHHPASYSINRNITIGWVRELLH